LNPTEPELIPSAAVWCGYLRCSAGATERRQISVRQLVRAKFSSDSRGGGVTLGTDLKSWVAKATCGFDPRPRHDQFEIFWHMARSLTASRGACPPMSLLKYTYTSRPAPCSATHHSAHPASAVSG
jgi:hypothetical protein